MTLLKCTILIVLSRGVLASVVNRPKLNRRRFGDNFAVGFGKRDGDIPTNRMRPQSLDTRTIQKQQLDLNSAKEPFWYTDSGPLPGWNTVPDYPANSYPGYGYIGRNPSSDKESQRLFEDPSINQDGRYSGGRSDVRLTDEDRQLKLLLEKMLWKQEEENASGTFQ